MLSKRWHIIENLWSKANDPTLSVHYIHFYTVLSETYEMLGRKEDVLKCQAKIMEKAEIMEKCEPGECDYEDLGQIYLNAEIYEQSAHFYELALQSTFLNANKKVRCLLNLYKAYNQLWRSSDARNILSTILSKVPQMLEDIALNTQIVLARFLINIHEVDHAAIVMDKLLYILVNASILDDNVVQEAVDLIDLLYDNDNYSTAVEIGHFVLKYLEIHKEQTHSFKRIKVNILMILATAEFKNGNFSVSLKHFDQSVALVKSSATEYKDLCRRILVICIPLAWLRPRCIRELYYCVITTISEVKKRQSHVLSGTPAPSISKELIISNDETLPILVSSFDPSMYITDELMQMAILCNSLLEYLPLFVFVSMYMMALMFTFLLPYIALCGHITCCLFFPFRYKSIVYTTTIALLMINVLLLIEFGFHLFNIIAFMSFGTVLSVMFSIAYAHDVYVFICVVSQFVVRIFV